MSRRVKVETTERARALRSNATREERKMWELLSRHRPKFTRQLPIGPYIADFACRQAKLVVEIGGSDPCARRRVPRRHPPPTPPFQGGEEALANRLMSAMGGKRTLS